MLLKFTKGDTSSERHNHHRRSDVLDDDLDGRGGDNGGHDSGKSYI